MQLIQLVKVYSSSVTFAFSFGFDAYLSWMQVEGFSTMGLNVKLFAFHELFFSFPNGPSGVGVSLPACLFLIILISHRRVGKE
jgi:hypothetical protein